MRLTKDLVFGIFVRYYSAAGCPHMFNLESTDNMRIPVNEISSSYLMLNH